LKEQEKMKTFRWTKNSAGTIALTLSLLSGCAYNADREAKMAANGPKSTRMSDDQYFALCTDQTPGGHVGPWEGPVRTSKEMALRDAGEHTRDFPGHHPIIQR
jgi:hypothetical protein